MGTLLLLSLLGAIFYYVFKSYSKYEKYSQEAFKDFSLSYEALKKSELGLFVALCAKVAKADGRVDALEAELISNMLDDLSSLFPEPKKSRELFKRIFNEEKEKKENIEHLAYAISHATKRSKAMQQQFMQFFIQLAFADGEVSKSEEQILSTIAEAMQFDPAVYHKIFDQFEAMMQKREPKQSIEDACRVLGVSIDDDMTTVKKAYRKLVRKYHPDIIKSQGKNEDYIKEATKKTQEINQAYEIIKRQKE